VSDFKNQFFYIRHVEFLLTSAKWNLSGQAGWHNCKASEPEFGGTSALQDLQTVLFSIMIAALTSISLSPQASPL
jgi:hypothetical protein